jgi:hypothetical protein
VALGVLVEWLEHPQRYRWVEVECDEAGSLDDVVSELANGSLVVLQVKFSAHPEQVTDALGWDALLKERQGRQSGDQRRLPSLWSKWAKSYLELAAGGRQIDAAVVSNRRPDQDIQRALLPDGHIDPDRIADTGVREEIFRQAGGEAEARSVLAAFRFDLDRPSLDVFEGALRRRFSLLGGTESGWLNLKDELRRWVLYHNEPTPDGQIRLGEIRRAAQWHELQSLPQAFVIPKDYVLPSQELHEEIMRTLTGTKAGCFVLTGSPGMGKSTYAGYLYEELRSQDSPILRHHYFLSVTEKTSRRVDHHRAAESLMHDLKRDYSESLGDLASKNPAFDELADWVEASGRYYLARGQPLVVVIDGLDHVWRESGSVDQLDKLLQMLLPALPGVVLFLATQPVDESLLPACLARAAPRDQWMELPGLELDAVRTWLRHHEASLTEAGEDQLPAHTLDRLAGTLYAKSNGHPLYLRYTLRAIQEQNISVTSEAIERLPGCPHKDISSYYAELWHSLPDDSRLILHLLAACRFTWPRDGIADCLKAFNFNLAESLAALRRVGHLMLPDALGLRPFHSSLLVFISDQPNHADHESQMQQVALAWLEARAPENWRWAYAWLLKADLNDLGPLLNGPNRVWLVEAISARRDREEIQAILARSLWYALVAKDLPRALELGALQEYGDGPFEFEKDILSTLLYAQLIVEDDPYLRKRLRTRLDQLRDEDVALMAEAEAARENFAEVGHLHEELLRRIRSDRRPDSVASSMRDWRLDVLPLLQSEACKQQPDVGYVVRIAARNQAAGLSGIILGGFASELHVRRDAVDFRRFLEAEFSLSTGQASGFQGNDSTTGTSDVSASSSERFFQAPERAGMLQHAVLLAVEQRLDFDDLLLRPENAFSPFVAIYAWVRKTGSLPIGTISLPDKVTVDTPHGTLTPSLIELKVSSHDVFFSLLVNHLQGLSERNTEWLTKSELSPWQGEFYSHLNGIAAELARSSIAGRMPSIAWFYDNLGSFPLPNWHQNRDEITYDQAKEARSSANQIGFSLLTLAQGTDGSPPRLLPSDIQAIFRSGYCSPENWIPEYVRHRRLWMVPETVGWLINTQEKDLDATILPYRDRAERYALLAAVLALHGDRDQARRSIRIAAENLIAHGGHKDMLLFQPLEAMVAVHKKGVQIQGCELTDVLRSWIRGLVPSVAAIDSFTDSDETGYLPRELSDTLAQVAPDWLPVYYRWLLRRSEYSDALDAFRAWLGIADLSDPVNRGVAKSAADPHALKILANRAQSGDQSAQEVLSSTLALLGERALDIADSESESSASPSTKPTPPRPEMYPPERLHEYIRALKKIGIYPLSDEAKRWSEHWAAAASKVEVLESLKAVIEREPYTHLSDIIFDLTLELEGREPAFYWLVRANSEDYGWARYFTERSRAVRRWHIVKEYYSDRWSDFIRDSLRSDRGEPWRGIGLGTQAWVRLVEYLLFMDQGEAAIAALDQMVKTSLELTSPQSLLVPEWLSEI